MLVLLLGGFAVVIGFGTFIMQPRRHRVRAAGKWLVIVSGLGAVGAAYGAWQAVQDPVRLDAWVGQPVMVQGTVLTAKSVAGGRLYELLIDGVQLDGQTKHCQVKADWAAWSPTGGLAQLVAGDEVNASGVLVFPPLKTSKGVPLRQVLTQARIFYEFEGHLTASAPPRSTLVTRIRSRLARSVGSLPYGTADQQVLLTSVVFGGENVSVSEKQVFLKAGLLHVLAASGANLMLVEQAVVRTLRPLWNRLRLPAVSWSLLLVAFNWGFALLCGVAPSMTRAAVLASYRHTGQMLSRRVRTLDGLAVAAVVQAIVSPSQITSASFLLSFAATAALALVLEQSFTKVRQVPRVGRLQKIVRVLALRVWTTIVTSAAIELALLPLTFTLFQQVTPYAVLTNVIAEPLLTLMLPVAALYIGVATLVSAWAPLVVCTAPLASVTYGMLSVVTWLANTVATWPGSLIATPALPNASLLAPGIYAFAALALFAASLWRKWGKRRQITGGRRRYPSARQKREGKL